MPYLATIVAVALALGVAYVLKPFIGIESADLVFLVAVIGVAYAYGLWPSMFAAVTSMLAYQFFFLETVSAFAFSDFKNYMATQDSYFQIPLKNPSWKLRLGLANSYNSQPPPKIKKLDTTYYTRLILDFGK